MDFAHAGDPVLTITVATSVTAVSSIWHELEEYGVSTPYQSLDWYDSWMRIVAPCEGEAPLILVAFDRRGRAVLLLPLVLRRRFSANIASFAGNKHANFHMPLFRSDVTFTRPALDHIFTEAARLRPDIDLFALDAQPAFWNGMANPLVGTKARPYTATATVLTLRSDPERLFFESLTADRRRRLRANDRKFHRFGIAYRRAVSAAEIHQALSSFSAHKTPWFLTRGLTNPFTPNVIAFIADLAIRSKVEIHCLATEHGSNLAVAATLTAGNRTSLLLISYDATSLFAAYSPGIRLIRDIIANGCNRGLSEFDFGLGEATYKTSFGAKSEPTYIDLRPQTYRGELAAALIKAEHKAKAVMKAHPRVLATVLRSRQKLCPLGG